MSEHFSSLCLIRHTIATDDMRTTCIIQIPFWGGYIPLGGQRIPPPFFESDVHYCIHKNPLLQPGHDFRDINTQLCRAENITGDSRLLARRIARCMFCLQALFCQERSSLWRKQFFDLSGTSPSQSCIQTRNSRKDVCGSSNYSNPQFDDHYSQRSHSRINASSSDKGNTDGVIVVHWINTV